MKRETWMNNKSKHNTKLDCTEKLNYSGTATIVPKCAWSWEEGNAWWGLQTNEGRKERVGGGHQRESCVLPIFQLFSTTQLHKGRGSGRTAQPSSVKGWHVSSCSSIVHTLSPTHLIHSATANPACLNHKLWVPHFCGGNPICQLPPSGKGSSSGDTVCFDLQPGPTWPCCLFACPLALKSLTDCRGIYSIPFTDIGPLLT